MEPQLTLNDIAAVIRVIDVISSRGGFKGEELSEVGALRDKYLAFLQAASAESESQESDEDEEVDIGE